MKQLFFIITICIRFSNFDLCINFFKNLNIFSYILNNSNNFHRINYRTETRNYLKIIYS